MTKMSPNKPLLNGLFYSKTVYGGIEYGMYVHVW